MAQKVLYLLRHAKAEPGSSGKDDHERRLIARGIRASEAMGKYMADACIRPEKILCSTAARARETCDLISASHKGRGEIIYIDRLYLASANEALQLIAKTPDSVHSLMVVGHNPGFHQLAASLAQEGDKALLSRLHLKFPTAALAIIAFDGVWKDIGRTRGTLQGFIMPDSL